jgi:hypothetical protein
MRFRETVSAFSPIFSTAPFGQYDARGCGPKARHRQKNPAGDKADRTKRDEEGGGRPV